MRIVREGSGRWGSSWKESGGDGGTVKGYWIRAQLGVFNFMRLIKNERGVVKESGQETEKDEEKTTKENVSNQRTSSFDK